MTTHTDLMELYNGYYTDGAVAKKREVKARQSLKHIMHLLGSTTYERVLDIGAGYGAVLKQLADAGLGSKLAAVEISSSGIDAIHKRSISNLISAEKFDEYKIPHPDNSFDRGLAIHVVEHVEHERMFLREAARVCRDLYIEVPLEHTRTIEKSIRVSSPHGHINFYTPDSFSNLIRTSGLEVRKLVVFPHDLELEQFMSGKSKGWLKHKVRTGLLRAAPKLATRNLVYMAGAICSAPIDKNRA